MDIKKIELINEAIKGDKKALMSLIKEEQENIINLIKGLF